MAKILIIEDDSMMSRMYQNSFSIEGFVTEIAKDGEEGIVKAKDIKPSLILLDVMMPKMNGLEALDLLKADSSTKDIPVVMLTNLSGEKDAETALSKGAAKYIIKSDFEPKQIIEVVKEILSQKPQEQILPAF